ATLRIGGLADGRLRVRKRSRRERLLRTRPSDPVADCEDCESGQQACSTPFRSLSWGHRSCPVSLVVPDLTRNTEAGWSICSSCPVEVRCPLCGSILKITILLETWLAANKYRPVG